MVRISVKALRSIAILYLFLFVGCQQNVSNNQKFFEYTLENETIDRKVYIAKEEGVYRFYRNGQPYYVKGVAGRENLVHIPRIGGNSVRVWYTQGLDTLLDRAFELDLTVMAGIYLGRERQGFDYRDSIQVATQKERVKETILKYKDHPALLAWALGNETELGSDDIQLWIELEELIQMIHKIDPNHPVTIVCIPGQRSVSSIAKYCPSVDFISVNAFGKIEDAQSGLRNKKWGWEGPYLYGEWGNQGYWESSRTDWYVPIELSQAQKCSQLQKHYEIIRSDQNLCLGSYAFYWGQKQERTATWFSFFDEMGNKTALVDVLQKLWDGGEPDNYAPLLDSMKIDDVMNPEMLYFPTGSEHKASVSAYDPDGDTLTYKWEIVPEGNYNNSFGGDAEERPLPVDGMIYNPSEDAISFTIPPHQGAYRLYISVYDGSFGTASTNVPFFAINDNLVDK